MTRNEGAIGPPAMGVADHRPAQAMSPAGGDLMPERIQRQRTAGWRMPEGVRYVGRPSRWGNPFGLDGRASVIGQDWGSVRNRPLHRGVRLWVDQRAAVYATHSTRAAAVAHAVDVFTTYCETTRRERPDEFTKWLAPLVGIDLACWCPLDQPCHADVLLELANG